MEAGVPFDKEAFRQGILTAMRIGTPNPSDMVTFYPKVIGFSHGGGGVSDDEGFPFDEGIEVTTEPPGFQALCAWESGASSDVESSGIVLQPSDVLITLLGEEYEYLKTNLTAAPEHDGFGHCVINEVKYTFAEELPAYGLATADVHQLRFTTADRS